MKLKKALKNVGELQYNLNIVNSCDYWEFEDGGIYDSVIRCYFHERNNAYPNIWIIADKKIISFILKGRAIKSSGLKTPMQRYLAWKTVA